MLDLLLQALNCSLNKGVGFKLITKQLTMHCKLHIYWHKSTKSKKALFRNKKHKTLLSHEFSQFPTKSFVYDV